MQKWNACGGEANVAHQPVGVGYDSAEVRQSRLHRFFIALSVIAAVLLFGQRPSAQGLTFSLFERYLESLRVNAGIPGLSALVAQDGHELWAGGLGRADVNGFVAARPDTPYLVGGLSQTVGAALLLRKCVDQSFGELNDPVSAWVPGFAEAETTLAHLLAHVAPSGAFNYNLTRFAALTPVIEACGKMDYPRLVAEEIFSRLSLTRSVPGTVLSAPTPEHLATFGAPNVDRYARVLSDLATAYRVDTAGRATPTTLPLGGLDAATGLVTTVRDFARFDAVLRPSVDFLLRPETLVRAWETPAPHLPGGLGWFVQVHNGELVAWQFGEVKDAYSALVVKVPNRRLTFIAFANSDALAAPFARERWDVNASVFAELFLRVFLP